MTREYTARDVVRAAAQQNAQVDQELQRMAAAEKTHQESVTALRGELDAAWRHLSELMVPGLDPAALDGAAHALGLPTIRTDVVANAMNAERAELQAAVARIDADPLFQQRDRKATELRLKLEEHREYIAPLRDAVGALESENGFKELVATGYGTPAYKNGWWNLSYYRHWKRADEIVETEGPRFQATDFAALLRRYREDRANYDSLRKQEADLMAVQKRITDLVNARQQADAALAALPQKHLGLVRARVREHLQPLDETERFKLCPTPDLQLASKRISGVDAKTRYLEGVHQEMVVKPRAAMEQMRAKNLRDMQKLVLPKNQGRRFSDEDYQRRFRDRSQNWNKRWDRYDGTYRQIVVYNDYHRWNPIGDFLWWDYMTDGHLDGNFIPEVNHWHSHHPGWSHHHDIHSHHDDAISAVASDRTAASDFRDAS
ncbi:MAG: hypothetical protein HY904_12025 [Deltaproteobacteria bacterium]|nr:hypothetical protein [Deltaproteobacteria bacterium]